MLLSLLSLSEQEMAQMLSQALAAGTLSILPSSLKRAETTVKDTLDPRLTMLSTVVLRDIKNCIVCKPLLLSDYQSIQQHTSLDAQF